MDTNKSIKARPIAFTSGVFDILHTGHVHFLLEFAKQSRVIFPEIKTVVVIHSDTAVKQKKGNDRPIFSQEEREQVIKAIKGIDEVIIWDGWENITDLVLELKPKVLAASETNISQTSWENNWQVMSEKIGAKLLSIPELKNSRSTSAIIEDICASRMKG